MLYTLCPEQNKSSSSSEDSAESTQIVKRKCSFVDDPKKKQRISSDLVLKATSISPVRNKSVCASDMIANLEGADDRTLPASVEIQRSPSLHKVYDKNTSSAKNLDNFKDYREPASSGNSSDEDETRPRTNDNLSSHEDISKQNTSIQQDQIIVVPQMNSEASGSFSSVEQAIQVFFEECKDQVLCNVSSSAKVQPFMPGIYHIKSKDEILELQCQDCSILVPLRKVDKKQFDEAPPTPIIDDNDDISDEGPVDPTVSSVADALLPIFVKELCE
ncbi:uncharacterized protein A4U43_C07F17400 [Asparagus officinalis]|uniref:Uncharacterized protein n=1 Tax=Asparagus officinalis TaxID=4686 RepID=A0A5P1ECV4_ASPOF|nr:uncharacterized protein A4U43_C07F17400 [Asparagus officinalis]